VTIKGNFATILLSLGRGGPLRAVAESLEKRKCRTVLRFAPLQVCAGICGTMRERVRSTDTPVAQAVPRLFRPIAVGG
jgi:hypothetical protein